MKTLIKSLRPSFLVLTPICVFLGLSTSISIQSEINVMMVILVMIGALMAHISVNTLNEYFDFITGLDFKTDKTPFSGGSGALPEDPEAAQLVLRVGIMSLTITALIGLYIISQLGMAILPVGLLGLIVVATYTQYLNRNPLLALVASGTGFGLLMVVGTHVSLTGGYSNLVWFVSLVPFFLVNNLLLLNQYPDMEADQSIGRKTFPIVFGLEKSNMVYAVSMVLAYMIILILVISHTIPSLSLIALLPMVLAIFALTGAFKFSANIGEQQQYLGANVAATILTPLLLSVGITFG